MDEKTENITLQFRTQSLETLIFLKIIERKYIGRLLRNDLKQRYFFYADKIYRKKIATQFLTGLCSVRNRLAADFFEFAARKKIVIILKTFSSQKMFARLNWSEKFCLT